MTSGQKSPATQLMIRTKENVLSGPFPKEEIVQRVLNGQLREADEVCAGDGYWIYLHERLESRALLGIDLPRTEEFHEEATETGTETATVTVTKPSVEDKSESAGVPTPLSENGRTESIRAVKLVVWGILIIVSFILFQVFRITQGF